MIPLSQTTSNHLYTTQLIKPFYFNATDKGRIWLSVDPDKPVDFLLLIHSNKTTPHQQTIFYEILATSKNTLYASIPINQPVEEILLKDLPLFIHLPYKSLNFENLLKNSPLSTDSSLYMTIQFRSATQETIVGLNNKRTY